MARIGCWCMACSGIALAGVVVWNNSRAETLRGFRARVSDYTNFEPRPSTAQSPSPIGKMIVIDRVANRVAESVYWKLPAEIRATKPDEVTTVVWLRTGHRVVGRYRLLGETSSSPLPLSSPRGSVDSYYVTVIDYETKAVIARQTLNGPMPPFEITANASGASGGLPDQSEIVTYLTGLKAELSNRGPRFHRDEY